MTDRVRAGVVLAPALLLVGLGWALTSGLYYTLDDPYIDLALARHILHGHYGLNPQEFAAPASSILWPFLLAPFAALPAGLAVAAPLLINLAALAVTLWWIAAFLDKYMGRGASLVATIVIALLFNLYGLVLTGMEHSLQVMLAVVAAISVVQRRFEGPFWASVTLLPFIRYEGLALSLATLVWLALWPPQEVPPQEALELRRRAVRSLAIIALGVGLFSLVLVSHTGSLLPASVLAKEGLHFWQRLSGPVIFDDLVLQLYFVALALFAAFLYDRQGRRAEAALLLLAPTAAHLLFGRYGWFGRYQIYWQIWVAILFLPAFVTSPLFRRPVPGGVLRPVLNIVLATGLVLATSDSVVVTATSPLAARNIRDQPLQMAAIASDYLDEPVAVNDLGAVSWRARFYVLDLFGLASPEALQRRQESNEAPGPGSGQWIADLMARHGVEQAIVHDKWFPVRPPSWIRVGALALPPPCITPGADHVSFYASDRRAAARLRAALERYRRATPGARLTVIATEGDGEGPAPAAAATPDSCDALRADHEMNALARGLYWLRRKFD